METVVIDRRKLAHFNIADLHAFHSLANRIDYFEEILSIVNRIGILVKRYRTMGYTCICLLNGDVAHKGSARDVLNDKAVQLIKLLISYFDETYLNFGNHEFTYYKNNPILKFIKDIEDVRILRQYPHIKGTSLTTEVRVVPRITYEDYEIGFTPYGFYPMEGDAKIKHMVMHDDIMSFNAYNRLSTEMPEYKINLKAVPKDVFDYVYCGHAHLVNEVWESGKTKIYNLASFGRSNAAEVRDDIRNRVVPVILGDNGKFIEVVDEYITLHKREDVIDEEKLLKSQLAYQATKERKIVRESLTIHQHKNPIEALMEDVRLGDNPHLNAIMDIVQSGRIVDFREVRQRVRERGLEDDDE